MTTRSAECASVVTDDPEVAEQVGFTLREDKED
jgi:hypothetical protein